MFPLQRSRRIRFAVCSCSQSGEEMDQHFYSRQGSGCEYYLILCPTSWRARSSSVWEPIRAEVDHKSFASRRHHRVDRYGQIRDSLHSRSLVLCTDMLKCIHPNNPALSPPCSTCVLSMLVKRILTSRFVSLRFLDPGHSRQVQSLLPAWVSQASSKQRRGRAGRVQPGRCWHLYPRSKYPEMDEYQLPEIVRTSLESLCLQVRAC